MKISVILPCFNGAKTIAVQLEALTRQQWDEGWEVIVSNNGSTDESMQIVEQYRHRLPELKIVDAHDFSSPRLGTWHSYNTGLRAATGDAFVLCEADDEVGDRWLMSMGHALREHEFVVARLDYRRLNPASMLGPVGARLQETAMPRQGCYPHYSFAWGCSFGFRRSLYEKLGEFSSHFNYGFDVEYCYRAQRAGIVPQFVPDAVMHYRLRHSLRDIFNQQQKWAEESNIIRRCYGSPRGKLPIIRKQLEVAILVVRGCPLWLLKQLGFPIQFNLLVDWVNDLGWALGEIKGLRKPVPMLIESSDRP
ncbi:glycosyltransferase family 2 protein [Thermoleptolyngbya sp. M55_K2018_002]|uniref:glycosyltransferase n=1 Tax=Thermoleptolyngbya sp. M55_K2018_002 TaxID=2747808 RepID=UPI001A08D3B2|nr:glycosyltransferase family A protein [Thermoleptolyngbya sp. M55_K2018_002]HIK42586.1 glycosyltransferase family 2 protein [Thermoleptolyngbya sp. M55_K2018_002]